MRKIVLLVFMIGIATLSYAQPYNIDFSFTLGMPKGDFSNSLDRNAFGVDLAFMYQINAELPLHFGIGLIYQTYGYKEGDAAFLGRFGEDDLDVETRNNFSIPQILMRIEPSFYRLSPFLEGSIGVNYIFTDSSISGSYDNDESTYEVNYKDFTTSFGIGAGAKYLIWEKLNENNVYIGFELFIKMKHFLGGEAKYLKEGDMKALSDDVEYIISKSRTDLTTFNIGVVLNL